MSTGPNSGFSGYHVLMPHRIRNVLLVSSAYDSFILEEDGRFSEQILGEYVELHLSRAPYFHQARSASEALEMIRSHDFDLVITTSHIRGMPPRELARRIKDSSRVLPVVLLTYSRQEALESRRLTLDGSLDYIFLWTGNPRILLALTKVVEDHLNLAHDTDHGRVRVILLVEDSPAFYSSYLPIIYQEIMEQTRSLMAERLTATDRIARMRARPKIVLARTFEEAEELYTTYHEYLLCIITDMRFPLAGRADSAAGLKLIQQVQGEMPDLPILLQSAEPRHRFAGQALRASFLDKNSPDLLEELRQFMLDNLGFGPFVFRDQNGTELARAEDVAQMLEVLPRIPARVLKAHAEGNEFSNWMRARSEFALADELRARQIDEFEDLEHARGYLLRRLSRHLEEDQRGKIIDFHRGEAYLTRDFTRLGTGSLGGKARGIAFMSSLLARHELEQRTPPMRVFTPRTVVLCTDLYDRFCEEHDLKDRARHTPDHQELLQLFLAHPLHAELEADLRSLLEEIHYPLAIRSSSLLEDSYYHPFAGIYTTYLLPNNDPDLDVRFEELSRAIRMIYASTFSPAARAYMKATGQRQEEEKMAIVIQRLVGQPHHGRFYPDFAGVARSHNHYPMGRMKPDDGVASVALGLGRTVVDGGKCLTFSPRYPRILVQMSTTEDALRTSQRSFWALDLEGTRLTCDGDDGATLLELGLEAAERDGTLAAVGATYVAADDRIHDTIRREGVRLVNFAPILKFKEFPLASLLCELLELVEGGVGTPVEMEFACLLEGRKDAPELTVLQIRPLVSQLWGAESRVDTIQEDERLLLQGRALGGGSIENLLDVVYIHPDRFDASQSREVAAAVGEINRQLADENRRYLLLGPGRWGTADPWLGIPVAWNQIDHARVMVEISVPGFQVDPSQGAHFFHNMTSMRIGYYTVDLTREGESVDLDWLDAQPAITENQYLRHLRLEHPLGARINSRESRGIIVCLPPRVGRSSDLLSPA